MKPVIWILFVRSKPIWFDGMGRTPEQVNQEMRKLLYEMNRQALAHEAKQLGKRLPKTQSPAFDRLRENGIWVAFDWESYRGR